jgi:ABC-type sugar transport system, permease component
MKKQSNFLRNITVGRCVSFGLLVFFAFIMMMPLFWTLGMAIKPDSEIYLDTFWPKEPDFSTFPRAIKAVPFVNYVWNTLKYVIADVTGTVISSTLVAYGFSRFNFKGKRLWFLILLATMMLPEQVTMVPKFLLFSEISWINTFLPMVVPRWFAVNAFAIFLIRQYMSGLPKDFDEAARIDGASSFRILTHIIAPMSKPAITAILIFTFLGTWSDFKNPLIYIYDSNKFTISLGLSFFKGLYTSQWNLLMAATLMSVLPIFIIFIVFQSYIIDGISVSSGTKG